MICLNCACDFEIKKVGSGGSNRIFCYKCLPTSSNRNHRNKLRMQILYDLSDRIKLNTGCEICGYNKNAKALEWHHHSNNKEFEPSYALRVSFEKFIEEILKCTLLCANCHREFHAFY